MSPQEIDRMVAEKIFKHEGLHGFSQVRGFKPMRYSSNIAAAWLIVEKLRETYADLELCSPSRGTRKGQIFAQFIGAEDESGRHVMINAWGATDAEAICLAALKSVGVEV